MASSPCIIIILLLRSMHGPLQGLFGLLKRAGYEVGAFGKVTNDQAGVLKKASEVTFCAERNHKRPPPFFIV